MPKRLLKQENRLIRSVIFGLLFVLVPYLLQISWEGYWKHYYETKSITFFYNPVEMVAEDICVGDLKQDISSVRYVGGTESGWKAEVIRELDQIENNNQSKKVFEEKADVFIETVPDGKVRREAIVPFIKEGVYQWRITVVKLYLPYNVVRVTSPSLVSNNFSVLNCNK